MKTRLTLLIALTAITLTLTAACLQPGVRAPIIPPIPQAAAACSISASVEQTGYSIVHLRVAGQSDHDMEWLALVFTKQYGVTNYLLRKWVTGRGGEVYLPVDKCSYGRPDTFCQLFAYELGSTNVTRWNEAFVIDMY